MSVHIVVGTQYGDEGKGKMVDYFAQKADLVVRFQGGDNAGHTVINEFGVSKLHLIPCGVFRPECKNLIGTGTVVNPDVLLEEIAALKSQGVAMKNLYLSEKAQLVMPWHVALDTAMEKSGGIGTTKRGIGQTYADKYLRKNLRAEDLRDLDKLREKIAAHIGFVNAQLAYYGGQPVNVDEIAERCRTWREELLPLLCNPFEMIHTHLDQGARLLFEGQLGVMKDIDLGIYPYVTSSNPLAAYAAVSGGFSPRRIDRVTGVCKAFSSAVGAGPFPTEMEESDAALLRGTGDRPDDEYGARTGRSRRLGWLDLPVLKFAHQVNGLDEIALTKLDKLDTLAQIKVCTHYTLDGKPVRYMPNTPDLYRVTPVYETLPGWLSDTTKCTSYGALPENAKRYINTLSDVVGAPVRFIGNGPERENIIVRD